MASALKGEKERNKHGNIFERTVMKEAQSIHVSSIVLRCIKSLRYWLHTSKTLTQASRQRMSTVHALKSSGAERTQTDRENRFQFLFCPITSSYKPAGSRSMEEERKRGRKGVCVSVTHIHNLHKYTPFFTFIQLFCLSSLLMAVKLCTVIPHSETDNSGHAFIPPLHDKTLSCSKRNPFNKAILLKPI